LSGVLDEVGNDTRPAAGPALRETGIMAWTIT
jgi:hypothetical protein